MNISVAGVAEKNGKVLIALRNPGTSIGVKWEFPGGKLEQGESHEQALVREYREELNAEIIVKEKLCEGNFSNGEKKYLLAAYRIEIADEEFTSDEHQKIIWTEIEKLHDYEFPDSDQIIVDYLLSR